MILHTPHNVKLKVMNYNKDLGKIFREAGNCSRNYRSTTPCRHIFCQATNSDLVGTKKLNHFLLRKLIPNTGTQYKHMKELSCVSLEKISKQSFLEITRPF